MWRFGFLVFISILFFSSPVFAHPGRTDAYGCHTCRTNCASWGLSYGEYHCHNAKTLPQPEEPIKSTYGEGGTRYTSPAPEYKNSNPIVPVSKNVTDQVRERVVAEKGSYLANHQGFREILFKKLQKEFGNETKIGFYIYTLLPDVK